MADEALNKHLKDIQEAAAHLKGVAAETPLMHSTYFSEISGNDIFIKPENLQNTGSFKLRGAYNRISQLSDEERARGIVTASAGNHAQGVAYAAQHYHCPCTIIMPEVTPLIKIKSAQEKGANVVIHGENYDQAYRRALEVAMETGGLFIHAYDDYGVICGQGTIALEMLHENPDLDEIIVPIGGGGLISGVAMAAKALKPDIRIIGVEPEGAASMKLSQERGKVTPLDHISTCAEGVAVCEVGKHTFEFVRDYVDEIITVNETEIMEAVLLLLEKHKLVAEASGALPLAALNHLKDRDKKIGCVISGGNIDMVTISSMIRSGLVTSGRIFAFSVELPDAPGQLLLIAKIIADQRANIIGLDHNQFKAKDRFNRVVLEVTVETNGHEHVKQIIKALEDYGFTINRQY
ncbi:MAG: threonine ammonia-lyase [Peptococcaceae bacterium]|nr:threonine ammonia-lyase [Peptococcaceae bacterium]